MSMKRAIEIKSGHRALVVRPSFRYRGAVELAIRYEPHLEVVPAITLSVGPLCMLTKACLRALEELGHPWEHDRAFPADT